MIDRSNVASRAALRCSRRRYSTVASTSKPVASTSKPVASTSKPTARTGSHPAHAECNRHIHCVGPDFAGSGLAHDRSDGARGRACHRDSSSGAADRCDGGRNHRRVPRPVRRPLPLPRLARRRRGQRRHERSPAARGVRSRPRAPSVEVTPGRARARARTAGAWRRSSRRLPTSSTSTRRSPASSPGSRSASCPGTDARRWPTPPTGSTSTPRAAQSRNAVFLTAERVAGRWTDRLVVISDEDEAAARRHHIVPSAAARSDAGHRPRHGVLRAGGRAGGRPEAGPRMARDSRRRTAVRHRRRAQSEQASGGCDRGPGRNASSGHAPRAGRPRRRPRGRWRPSPATSAPRTASTSWATSRTSGRWSGPRRPWCCPASARASHGRSWRRWPSRCRSSRPRPAATASWSGTTPGSSSRRGTSAGSRRRWTG